MAVDKRLADVGNFIRQQRELAQQSIRDLAKVAGVSNPYLSQIERGLRKPSAEILQQLARAMKISAESLYERAGILDPSDEPRPGVVDAVSSDERLTIEQKQTLLSVYRSFVGEEPDSTPR
jgi:transcriptional regulator with XRE-family HTH domain